MVGPPRGVGHCQISPSSSVQRDEHMTTQPAYDAEGVQPTPHDQDGDHRRDGDEHVIAHAATLRPDCTGFRGDLRSSGDPHRKQGDVIAKGTRGHTGQHLLAHGLGIAATGTSDGFGQSGQTVVQ